MTRPLRIDYQNAWHHVMNRARRGSDLFVENKSILVDADSYVLQLVRCIHRNPLEAGLVKGLDRYAWSSHNGYLSLAKKWNWLLKDVVLRMLTEDLTRQIQDYKQLMTHKSKMKILCAFLTVNIYRRWLAAKNLFPGSKIDFSQRKVTRKFQRQKDRKFKGRLTSIENNILKDQT